MSEKQTEPAPVEPQKGDPLKSLTAFAQRGPAPVHLWNPPYCGEIDMRIARDGTWFYNGSPIGRPALVKLFAGVLRRDPERYVLVTPVECVGIKVDDAPFLGVELLRENPGPDQVLKLRTNVDDWVTVSPENPLRFEPGDSGGLKPYAKVRGELWALLTRALFYDLVEWGESRAVDGEELFGIASGGGFFAMAPLKDLSDLAASDRA